MWDRAHQTAQRYLPQAEVSSMYFKEAQALEEAGKLKEAETLYVNIGQPELAIAMYKKVFFAHYFPFPNQTKFYD